MKQNMFVQSRGSGVYPLPVCVSDLAISSGPVDRRRVKAVAIVLGLILAVVFAAKAQTENAFGPNAGNGFLTGSFNTAFGYSAFLNNITGNGNSSYGNHSLINNTNGQANTAIGVDSLLSNTSGSGNIAVGYSAGQSNFGTPLGAVG